YWPILGSNNVHILVELLQRWFTLGYIAVAPHPAIGRLIDVTFLYLKRRPIEPPFSHCRLLHQFPARSCGYAQYAAHLRCGGTSVGAPVIGAQLRVAHNHGDGM